MNILFLLIISGSLIGLHSPQQPYPIGQWQVEFALINSHAHHVVLTIHERGDGFFQLLDTGIDDKPVAGAHAAVWSLTNNDLSFSGEIELQMGDCCRQMGTLIFKGKLTSSDSISGKLIFITNVDEEESPYKYKSTIGTFTAKRLK